MTNEEILKKAIEKAEKNGWGDGSLYNIVNDDEVIYQDRFTIIFNHKFAKAFWGEEYLIKQITAHPGISPFSKMKVSGEIPAWKYHLQIMVLEEDPIKYLEKFLD